MFRRTASVRRRRLRRLTLLGSCIGGVAAARAATLSREERRRPDLVSPPEALVEP